MPTWIYVLIGISMLITAPIKFYQGQYFLGLVAAASAVACIRELLIRQRQRPHS